VQALFPLGRLHKSQVRAIAQEAGLATAKRGDSYGICFIGKRKLDGFLPNYIDVTAGEFRDVDTGNIMGACQLLLLNPLARADLER